MSTLKAGEQESESGNPMGSAHFFHLDLSETILSK
jgi:hypothetical protein